MDERRAGVASGLAAYGLWGVIPIFFKAINAFATSYEILAHRIVWSALVLVIVLTLLRRWKDLYRALRDVRSLLALMISAVLIGLNWFVYIYSVETHRVMQSSLGYFITPLVNVALGVFVCSTSFSHVPDFNVSPASPSPLFPLRIFEKVPYEGWGQI